MKTEQTDKTIHKALAENDSMAAYSIFLTHLDEINKKVASILRDSPDACEDWTRDEILRLALNKLSLIRKPESWKTFITVAVCNRAKSRVRKLLLQFTSSDRIDPEPQEPVEFRPVTKNQLYNDITLRDRAVLKLSYSIHPDPIEWQALSIATQRSVAELQNGLADHLNQHGIVETELLDKLVDISNKLLILQRKQSYLEERIDWLSLVDPSDEEDILRTTKELQETKKSYFYQYSRYRKLQNPRPQRIRAAIISNVSGLSINEIHQIVSRARRKIKVNKA